MILGIGTDLCDIRRIENSIEKYGDRFLNKIFTKAEQDYCEAKSSKGGFYAKRFAAKEAVAKALARSNTGSLSWQDVEITNEPSGRPRVTLYRGAKLRFDENIPDSYCGHIHLSLTDDYPYAHAYVIAEARPVLTEGSAPA